MYSYGSWEIIHKNLKPWRSSSHVVRNQPNSIILPVFWYSVLPSTWQFGPWTCPQRWFAAINEFNPPRHVLLISRSKRGSPEGRRKWITTADAKCPKTCVNVCITYILSSKPYNNWKMCSLHCVGWWGGKWSLTKIPEKSKSEQI